MYTCSGNVQAYRNFGEKCKMITFSVLTAKINGAKNKHNARLSGIVLYTAERLSLTFGFLKIHTLQ